MAIDEKKLKALSNALGLGDAGLVADKAGAALAYPFTDKAAATRAEMALENLKPTSLTNFASVEAGAEGKYKLVISEAGFNAIADIKSSDLKSAKDGLQEAMQQDKTAIAANEKKLKELDAKFAALGSGVNAKDMSFETKAYAEELSAIISQTPKIALGNSSDTLTTVKQAEDGRWVVEFNKAALGKSDRTVDDITKDVVDFKDTIEKRMTEQRPNIAALGTALGVGIRMDGDANYIKMEGMPDKTVDAVVEKLNSFGAGIATKAKDRIVINEDVLAGKKIDFTNLTLNQQMALGETKDMISAGYIELLNKSKASNNNGWQVAEYGSDKQQVYFDKTKAFETQAEAKAEAEKLSAEFKLTVMNGFSDRQIGDKYYATISQRSLQLESGAKAIAEVNDAAAKADAEAKKTADAAKAPAAGAAGTVTPSATPPAAAPAAPPPPEESDMSKNMFTLIGAAIPALLMLSGMDILPALLLMVGGLLIGGMLDKEKGGFVGQMIGKVMGKDGPSLDGLDTSKDRILSKDELAAGLDKDKSGKLDTKELSALSDDERKKLFDALQANANKDAVKTESGKMVEVDLDKITTPINLPAAAPATGSSTPAK